MSALGKTDISAAGNEKSWRDINFDIGWEASQGGIVRCGAVLNQRSDVFAAVEGLSLRDIRCETPDLSVLDLLTDRTQVRHVAVRLPKKFGTGRLYLTARRLPSGNIVGTFCSIEPRDDETLRERVHLMMRVSQARTREESYRQDTEAMLRGLRLLLGESKTSEKLVALGDLLKEAIKGTAGLVVRIVDGTPCALDGTDLPSSARASVAALWLLQRSPVCVYGEMDSHVRAIHNLLGVGGGEVALISLPVASETIVFFCSAGRAGVFAADDVGFAGRFALILRQAALLKEQQDKLVQSAKLSVLGQMSASLAHELRQPLNTIGLAAQNLERLADTESLTSEVVKTKLQRILAQIQRADTIIDRVRRFSRKAADIHTTGNLAFMTHSVRVLSEHVLQESGVRLEIDVPETIEIRCDTVQIEQLLANLVRNAVDAISGVGSASAQQDGVIHIRGWKAEDETVLRVEDNGPGFPAHLLDRPMEAFATTKGADAGTGLGMSICQTIAREHGGRLAFGNAPAGGAFVELHLPDSLE